MKKLIIIFMIVFLVVSILILYLKIFHQNIYVYKHNKKKYIEQEIEPFRFKINRELNEKINGPENLMNKDMIIINIYIDSILTQKKDKFTFQIFANKLTDTYVDTDGFFPQNFSTKDKRLPAFVVDTKKDKIEFVNIRSKFSDKDLYRGVIDLNEPLDITYYELYKIEDNNYYYGYPWLGDEYEIIFTCKYDPELSKEEMDEELMKEEMERYLKECDRIVESIQWVGWDE